MKLSLNQYQKLLLETFDGGEFAHFIHHPGPYAEEAEVTTCGNLILTMLLVELSDKEGCDNRAVADARVGKIMYQLDEFRQAMMEMARKERQPTSFSPAVDMHDGVSSTIQDAIKNVGSLDLMGGVVGKKYQ